MMSRPCRRPAARRWDRRVDKTRDGLHVVPPLLFAVCQCQMLSQPRWDCVEDLGQHNCIEDDCRCIVIVNSGEP